ncbi:MAG TPA: DNA mismatch repair endonuclease MutL [Bacteroidales bacterium]
MSDIIKLLPDSVANQIAAGEVIQRPASVVKELMENAIDAGANDISLVIKDAGKTLIQVIDNGSGMSGMDARMSFERHATSKINSADDLFAIRTMGFRGEALASIAAIAQVELKTRPHDDELGTSLIIEGSKVISQEPCQCSAGTNFLVKNLFFNVPARRNFLKSNNAETRNIIEEFTRVSLFQPEVSFSLVHNEKIVFKLTTGSLKSRIIGLFGNSYNTKLLPVGQETDHVSISGFISKPEFAKKTRGEQYFFVNGRFIKHSYLHHAIANAYKELISSDSFPSYFLNIEVDPADIDINIHPTKTEVNFKDTQYIYAIIHAAVKQSIGKHSFTPTIDFNPDPDYEAAFQQFPKQTPQQPEVRIDKDFNPFNKENKQWQGKPESRNELGKNWEILYQKGNSSEVIPDPVKNEVEGIFPETTAKPDFFQLHNRYILCNVRSGLMVIDQQNAVERIIFEETMQQLSGNSQVSQQQLFPQNIHFSPGDAEVIRLLKKDLVKLGFHIEEFGSNGFVVNGIPTGLNSSDIMAVLEKIVENFKLESKGLTFDKNIILARSIAVNKSARMAKKLSIVEMADIFDRLFACQVPEISASGKKTLTIVGMEEIDKMLKK